MMVMKKQPILAFTTFPVCEEKENWKKIISRTVISQTTILFKNWVAGPIMVAKQGLLIVGYLHRKECVFTLKWAYGRI